MLAQSNAGRWSIHICVGSSEQAVSLDSACAISLYRCSITSFPEAWYVVVATVPGHQAAVRVWNRTGRSSLGCYPENRGTQRVRGRVGTGPQFHITVPATLPPIRYLSSDRIVTGSVRKSCIFSPSFTSRCQICDWANIRWIAVKYSDISAEKCGFSIATQRILVGSPIWEREEKEGLTLHNLRTNHVTIRSELRYLIGAKIVDLKCRVFGGHPLERSGSGLEPDPEPDREFGPVANTNGMWSWGCSGHWNVWGGGYSISRSPHLHLLPHFPESRTGRLPPRKDVCYFLRCTLF